MHACMRYNADRLEYFLNKRLFACIHVSNYVGNISTKTPDTAFPNPQETPAKDYASHCVQVLVLNTPHLHIFHTFQYVIDILSHLLEWIHNPNRRENIKLACSATAESANNNAGTRIC
jgi:hypothetical protein